MRDLTHVRTAIHAPCPGAAQMGRHPHRSHAISIHVPRAGNDLITILSPSFLIAISIHIPAQRRGQRLSRQNGCRLFHCIANQNKGQYLSAKQWISASKCSHSGRQTISIKFPSRSKARPPRKNGLRTSLSISFLVIPLNPNRGSNSGGSCCRKPFWPVRPPRSCRARRWSGPQPPPPRWRRRLRWRRGR